MNTYDWRGEKLETGQRVKYCGDFAYWQGTVIGTNAAGFVEVQPDGMSYTRNVHPWYLVVMDEEETQHDI